ncbi:hypothetical protein EJB05_55933 [Eragrostis curvula]|uniref:Aquaporin n=1 Tax=Eragrostis curvula TaxID=38414 RepID=A0A5J9SHK5_9POAL|nr:hypothetical protein EJB05_55933 [Eragrostis curvula]
MKECFSRLRNMDLRAKALPILAEFVSSFLFEFISIAIRMLRPDISYNIQLLITAIVEALGLSAAVFIAADVSGGHINPAVTLAFAIGGHISIPTAIFYGASQMLASMTACLCLNRLSAHKTVRITRFSLKIKGIFASILEGVMTFVLVLAVLVALDPLRADTKSRAARMAFVAGLATFVSVLTVGPLTGASLNPAHSFGPAFASGKYHNQVVYWVGPMIAGAVAAPVYRMVRS